MFNAKSRDEIESFITRDNHRKFVLELSTGAGKSRFSILKIAQWRDTIGGDTLIVVPKLVLIDNWKTEFRKFGHEELLDNVTFSTYNSLQKHTNKKWMCVIYDEVQHLSERCRAVHAKMSFECLMMLSATINRDLRNWIWSNIRGLEWIRMNLRDAIDNEVLPNPKVILVPMTLDHSRISEVIIKNPKSKIVVDVPYRDKYKCRDKSVQYRIHCTEQQWYDDTQGMIDWLDKHASKMAYLKKCGDRNKWLSDIKTPFVKEMLKRITRHRAIVFCNSIAQSRELGANSINSKDGVAQDVLDRFNNGEINRVTAVNMLNEGINAIDCKIGVFANMNSSDIMTVQRIGRILRHESPVIIIPYYRNTRDEQLMEKMTRNCDPGMIVTINSLDELKNHIK